MFNPYTNQLRHRGFLDATVKGFGNGPKLWKEHAPFLLLALAGCGTVLDGHALPIGTDKFCRWHSILLLCNVDGKGQRCNIAPLILRLVEYHGQISEEMMICADFSHGHLPHDGLQILPPCSCLHGVQGDMDPEALSNIFHFEPFEAQFQTKLPHKSPHRQKNNRASDFSDARNPCKMAEREGFEPSQPCDSNDLANRPLQPLEYRSKNHIA